MPERSYRIAGWKGYCRNLNVHAGLALRYSNRLQRQGVNTLALLTRVTR